MTLKAEIIKLLPDNWTYVQRYQFFTELADDYRRKSQREVATEDKKFREKKFKK